MVNKNIIKSADACIIYVSRTRRVGVFVLNLLLTLMIIIISVRSKMYESGFTIFFMSIAYICLIITLYSNIKQVLNPPAPIIITPKELSLPDGEKIRWENIKSIFLKPGSYTPPILCIQTTKQHNIDLLDWYLYAEKKQLISLFEEYAGRKLYIGIRLKGASVRRTKREG